MISLSEVRPERVQQGEEPLLSLCPPLSGRYAQMFLQPPKPNLLVG